MRRLSIFLLRLILIGIAMHVYVGMRLVPDLSAPAARWLFSAWLVLSCGLIPLGMLSRGFERRAYADLLAWVGMLAMGYFSSLLVLCALRDLALGLLQIAHWLQPSLQLSPVWRSTSAAAVPGLALLICALGLFNARRRARVKHVSVSLDDLDPALEGFTIVQLSDIHIGPTIKHRYVSAIVDVVNQLKPDLIAITGDVVDGSVAQLAAHAAPLGRLQARHGTFLVTGNHEYYAGADAWVTEFRRLGMTVLLNEHRTLEHGRGALVIAGVTDYTAGHFNPAQRSDPQRALAGAPGSVKLRILLAHQPRSAEAAEQAGFSLQLSGHTHGGQFLPWNFFVPLQQPFVAGLSRFRALWVYTSRGTGYWGPPKRFGAPSEITYLELVRA